MNQGLPGFDFLSRTRLVFDTGAIRRIGDLATELLPGARVLLVSDPGILKAGHVDSVRTLLEAAGHRVTVFSDVKENPTTREAKACTEVAREAGTQLIVGLGGGSSLDTAKACNFLLTNGGRMQDYWGIGKATKPMLPLIAIPTTAGTGSECQSFSLIADEDTHQKMACGDPKAAARIALLDPALTTSQPRQVTCNTGADTIAHAVESAVSLKRNAFSWLFSRESFCLSVGYFSKVIDNPQDLFARGRMQLAAAYGGMAIENSMLGAAHAAANPLTAKYRLIHGQAVSLMLPHVIRFNAEVPEARLAYCELAIHAQLVPRGTSESATLHALLKRLDAMLNKAGIPRSLEVLSVNPDDLNELADQAARQWTATFNPRPLAKDDFIVLYRKAFEMRGDGDL